MYIFFFFQAEDGIRDVGVRPRDRADASPLREHQRPEDRRGRSQAHVTERQARGGTLIVGGGFAGAYVARLLGRAGATIASPENFMLYTPMLPEAASGTLEPRHVVVPLRIMCRKAELLLGRVMALDTGNSCALVKTEHGDCEITYRDVVVALGSVSRTLPIPGLAAHGRGFKTLADAIHL